MLTCRGDTRPARGSKLTLLSKRTVDGYHPSRCLRTLRAARAKGSGQSKVSPRDKFINLPCVHGPSRAASSIINAREASERSMRAQIYTGLARACQTSKTRMCARLEIRTGRLAVRAKCSASEMQSCWLDKARASLFHGATKIYVSCFGKTPRRPRCARQTRLSSQQDCISLALRSPLRDATYVCERGDLSAVRISSRAQMRVMLA